MFVLFVAPKSVKTAATGGDVASSALSPSRSVDSQLNNLSVTVSTPVSQHNMYVHTRRKFANIYLVQKFLKCPTFQV